MRVKTAEEIKQMSIQGPFERYEAMPIILHRATGIAGYINPGMEYL
jgi:hypothetical protein